MNGSIDIPPLFFDSDSDRPFEKCLVCGCSLIDSGIDYMIEKAFRIHQSVQSRDLIFEYAICIDCYAVLWSSFSKESISRIEAYFAERVDFESRVRQLRSENDTTVDKWISNCLITGEPVQNLKEFQIVAHCRHDRLVLDIGPYMVSGQVIDEVVALLSNKTLDDMNRFRDSFLGGPPELEDLLNPTRFVFV
jgi:hypothetical protein